MIFEVGEKLHIIERRYFESDLRRHFVGEIVKCSENLVRISGYAWIYNSSRGSFVKKLEKRERVISLSGDNRLTINLIPREVDIESVAYSNTPERGLVVTDGKSFSLDVSEFTSSR